MKGVNDRSKTTAKESCTSFFKMPDKKRVPRKHINKKKYRKVTLNQLEFSKALLSVKKSIVSEKATVKN